MFAETTKGKRAVIREGYLFQKIQDNGPKSWWRCQDRSCNGRLCMDDDIVINVSGIHHHPPNKAKVTAQTVIKKELLKKLHQSLNIC